MNRRHFLASVSATAIMPMRTFAAQDALRLKAEMVTQQILPDGDGATSMLGAVRRMRTRIGFLAQPEPMRSIVGATQ